MSHRILIALLALLTIAPGCRNQCGNSCWRPFRNSSTIAAPPTYSLQIPNVANQQYYAPGTTGFQNNPNVPAQPPATNIQAQPGWNTTPTNNQGASYAPTSYGVPNLQVASSTVYAANGKSHIVSPDYNSTYGNERLDPSRLAVSDASGVRAPTQYIPPNYNRQASYDPRNSMQSGAPGAYDYRTQPRNNLIQGQSVVQGQFGPSFAGQTQFTGQPNPNFAAQSNQRNVQQGPNVQAGWRDRQTADGSNGVNR